MQSSDEPGLTQQTLADCAETLAPSPQHHSDSSSPHCGDPVSMESQIHAYQFVEEEDLGLSQAWERGGNPVEPSLL